MKTTFEGHSFVEVLVGMAILVSLSGVLIMAIFTTRDYTESFRNHSNQVQSLLFLQDGLETLVQRVLPPWWASSDHIAKLQDEQIVFSFLDGVETKTLFLSYSEGWLMARVDDVVHQWGPYERLSMKLWEKDLRPVGLLIEWESVLGQRTLRYPLGRQGL